MNISILDEAGNQIKFLKIIPYKSGGFAIILPKLLSQQFGRLEKTDITYENDGTHIVTKRNETEQYSAKDIVKFSYHPDGFVQFSSASNNKIKSGRNPDGTPKGLGVLSWPLENPINTGASMTISLHGLEGFEKANPAWIDRRFVFETARAVRHPKGKYEENGKVAFAMAFYIIPNSIRGVSFEIDGKKISQLAMMQGLPNGKAFMRLREEVRIIDIPNQSFRIGISWFQIPDNFEAEPGYVFLGPTDGRHGLVASYPGLDYGKDLQMKDLEFIQH